MASMGKILRARLGASALFLASLTGKPGFAQASKIQATAFASNATSDAALNELTDSDRAALLQMASEAGFAEPDFEIISSALLPPPRQQPARRQRRPMQDFDA